MEQYPDLKSISFSALKDHKDCSWYFLLKNILRLEVFTSNVHTHYGTLLHRYVQDVLTDKITPEAAAERFAKTWERFCKLYNKQLVEQGHTAVIKNAKSGASAIQNIKESFKQEFGEYKVLAVEESLRFEIEGYPQVFRGSIDTVIELANGTRFIIDFKTCGSKYYYLKNKDKYSDYQLTLYKHFYSLTHQFDKEKIETIFVVVEKTVYNKNPIFFLKITSGPKKIENALEWLNNALNAVSKKVFLKNRSNCQAYGRYCTFYNTDHCSLSNQPQKDLLKILP